MAEQEYYRVKLVMELHDRTQSALARMQGASARVQAGFNRAKRAAQALGQTIVSPTATLKDKVTSTVRTVRLGLGALAKGAWSVTVKAVDKASSVLGGIKRAIFSLKGLAATVLLGLGVGGLWGATTGYAAEMEQSQVAFSTMLDSQAAAQEFIGGLQRFATLTPFEFPDIQQAARNMLSFGFASEDVLPTLTAVGDAVSGLGLGAEGMDRVIRALGQMRTKGKLSGEEMLQLTEAGIGAWDILAKKMGISTAQVMDLTQKGLLPADRAIRMLVEGMEDRFGGMMAAQSRTYTGLMSSIKDYTRQMLGSVGTGFLEAINPRLQRIVDWFGQNEATVARWKDMLTRFGRQAAEGVLGKLERAFKWIDEHYLSNPEFMKADWGSKFSILLDDFATQVIPKVGEVAGKIAVEFGRGMVSGVMAAAKEDPISAVLLGLLAAWIVPGPPQVKMAIGGAIAGYGVVSWGGKKVGENLPGSTYYVEKKLTEEKADLEFAKEVGPTMNLGLTSASSLGIAPTAKVPWQVRFWNWLSRSRSKYEAPEEVQAAVQGVTAGSTTNTVAVDLGGVEVNIGSGVDLDQVIEQVLDGVGKQLRTALSNRPIPGPR